MGGKGGTVVYNKYSYMLYNTNTRRDIIFVNNSFGGEGGSGSHEVEIGGRGEGREGEVGRGGAGEGGEALVIKVDGRGGVEGIDG